MRRRRGQTMEERFLRAGAVEPEKRERRKPHWFLAGLLRFFAIVALSAGASVALGFLLGLWLDWDSARSVTLGLYLGGALMVGVGGLSWGGQGMDTGGYTFYEEMSGGERLMHQCRMGVYVLIGVIVIGLGVAAEMLLA